ncbi:MAG: mercuric reductase [Verrucomicrobiales bacterium]
MMFAVEPRDEYNLRLLAQVHPANWVNPKPAPRYHLVVIGAGTGGLVTAAGAAGLGAKVALIERHLMGGDCLNVGCVPSKTLIAAARETSADLHQANFAKVMERVRKTRAEIAPQDSAQRFQQLGIDVFFGEGRFVDGEIIEVDGKRLRFARAVIATGARAATLPMPGLADAGYLTNETVFNLTRLPRRLGVIGGGPIGCELAQAFLRLGSEVTLIQSAPRLLPREDSDAAEVVQRQFAAERMQLVLSAKTQAVVARGTGKLIEIEAPAGSASVEVDDILLAVGRAPNVQDLNLEAAGIEYESHDGVKVDDHLRTTNPRVYAAGDVCMRWKFTHAADFAARIVIQNALFLGRKRLSALNVPCCTYTDPELARTGLGLEESEKQGISIDVWRRDWSEVDRARAEADTNGFVRILTKKGTDKILGATIVGSHAGEMISEISVAMAAGMGLGKLARVIHPYPTRAEVLRQLGDAYNRTRLTPRVRKWLVRWLKWTC